MTGIRKKQEVAEDTEAAGRHGMELRTREQRSIQFLLSGRNVAMNFDHFNGTYRRTPLFSLLPPVFPDHRRIGRYVADERTVSHSETSMTGNPNSRARS
jgi:hypothetical protein